MHLDRRRRPGPPWQQIPAGSRWPLAWGLSAEAIGRDASGLLGGLERWARGRAGRQAAEIVQRLESWLESAADRPRDTDFALECLAWSYVLPGLSAVLPAGPWSQLLAFLAKNAGLPGDDCWEASPLVHQLLAAELPLTLAYWFPELAACRRLGQSARHVMAAALDRWLDDGLPPASELALARPLLACWTRCRHLGAGIPGWGLGSESTGRFARFVRRAVQLTRGDGASVFSGAEDRGADRRLWEAAYALIEDDEERAAAGLALPKLAMRRTRAREDLLPSPAAHSEHQGVAVLRRHWKRSSEHLVVAWQGGQIRSELNCGLDTIWSGPSDPWLQVDGQRLRPTANWEQVCWFTDDDVDYLELERELSPAWRIQRQMFLAREDHFLYLADAVFGRDAADLEYRLTLPLCPGVQFAPAVETREGHLVAGRRLGRVVPLALPEWRLSPAGGELELRPEGLQLRQFVQAPRLYAPLLIDLKPGRLRGALTWRQLTVGEKRQIQPPSAAVGYRVQLGQDQWLIYRSLAPQASRTLLGQNLNNEFAALRFDRNGEVDELIRIDA